DLVPTCIELVPGQGEHPALRMQVEDADVRTRPMLYMVHQRIQADLEQVTTRVVGWGELVVEDAMVREPPVVEDVVADAGDVDRLARWSDLEGHVDTLALVAEEVAEDLTRGLAARQRVGHDIGQLGHVDADGPIEGLRRLYGLVGQGGQVHTVPIEIA